MKLRLLLFVPMLLLLCAGDSPTRAPLGEPVAHIHESNGIQVGIVSLSSDPLSFQVIGPVTGWGAWAAAAGGPTHQLESTWVSGGITHTVRTKVGGSMDLAMKRHDKMLNKMKEYYPPDP